MTIDAASSAMPMSNMAASVAQEMYCLRSALNLPADLPLCRVGAGIVIPGLDEGLLTMRPGGIRRLFIPGNLAFPNGLKAAAGRARVPPASPVVFDVQLLYIPGTLCVGKCVLRQ